MVLGTGRGSRSIWDPHAICTRPGAEVLALAVLIGLVLCVYVVVRIDRWRHTPRELRGNWWAAFEREFWDYVNRVEAPPRPRQRRNDHGSIGQ
jgi:hypothetical protein